MNLTVEKLIEMATFGPDIEWIRKKINEKIDTIETRLIDNGRWPE